MIKIDISKESIFQSKELPSYANWNSFRPKTPEVLYNWMVNNLSYYGVPKKYLYAPDEVLNKKKVHCWEATSFAYKFLGMMGFDCSIIYIETSDLSATHTAVFYSNKHSAEVHWFEYTWEHYRGIHRYKSMQDFIEDIAYKFKQDYKNISLMSIGNTLITEKTLQSGYYKTMTNEWDRVYPKFTKLT